MFLSPSITKGLLPIIGFSVFSVMNTSVYTVVSVTTLRKWLFQLSSCPKEFISLVIPTSPATELSPSLFFISKGKEITLSPPKLTWP